MGDLIPDRVFELEETIRKIQILVNQHLPFTAVYEGLRNEVNKAVKEAKLLTYEV